MAVSSIVSQSVARIGGAITPSDTVGNIWSYIYVGTGGDIALATENGDAITLTAVPQGSWVWVRTSLVKATGTSASNLVGFK